MVTTRTLLGDGLETHVENDAERLKFLVPLNVA